MLTVRRDRAGAEVAEHQLPIQRSTMREAQGEAAVGHQTVADPATGAQVARRRPEYLKTGAIELADAAEPGRGADLGDGQVGVVEQAASEVRPAGARELVGGDTEMLVEQPPQMPRGDAQPRAELVLGVAVESPVDHEPHGAADELGVGPAEGRVAAVGTASQAGPKSRGLGRCRR